MKNLILTAILLLPTLASAQDLVNVYCEECRDLTEFPEDARNFSYNQVFGPRSWLTMDQADLFEITDNFGNTVIIDMNVNYQVNLWTRFFDFGNAGKLVVDGLVVQIRVIYRNLDIVTYLFTRREVRGELPVGDSNTRRPPSGTGAGGGDDGDGDSNDTDDYEYEDTIDEDEVECEECTLRQIYPDGSLGEEVDMPTGREWEEIQEL